MRAAFLDGLDTGTFLARRLGGTSEGGMRCSRRVGEGARPVAAPARLRRQSLPARASSGKSANYAVNEGRIHRHQLGGIGRHDTLAPCYIELAFRSWRASFDDDTPAGC
jgi:hypothetical protein